MNADELKIHRDYHVMREHAYYMPKGSWRVSHGEVVELSPGIWVHPDDGRSDDEVRAEFAPMITIVNAMT